MITDVQLFEVVKSCLPEEIIARFNFVKTVESIGLKLKIIPNTITISFRPAEKPVRDLNGNYIRMSKRVIFNIYTDCGGSDAVNRGFEYIEIIKENLNKIHNCVVVIKGKDGDTEVPIIDCQLIIDGYHVGKTDQGIHYFSLEYKIIY